MLQTLELTNFRSYKNGLFGFEPGVNIIVGANASGKTNLLEAIHTICTLQGFNSAEKDLISISSEWSRLEALTDDGTRVAKIRIDGPKSMELDGDIKKRLSSATVLPVVVFEPEHMLLLGNEPERRRAYIDGILSATSPAYKSALAAYRRSLSQRNKLLKQENLQPEQLFVWDLQLAQRAGVIVAARAKLIKSLNKICARHYQSISKNSDTLRLEYVSKIEQKNYSDNLLAHLKNTITTDRQRGFTGAGPHRDDLYVELNGSDARVTSSRGEIRSIVLALKIAELEMLKEQTGKSPVFLLDDVFSELDGSRRRHLADMLSDYQSFITTTDADIVIEHFQKSCNIIPVS